MDENNCKYVSSRGILKSCDIYSTTPISGIRELLAYDFSRICDGSIIYICVSAIPYFVKNIFNNLNHKIILVTGDNDETIPSQIFTNEEFMSFIESDKIIHWFSQNCVLTTHPKLTQIPIGLDYHTMSREDHWWGNKSTPLEQEVTLEGIKSSSAPFYERDIKAYSNFHFAMSSKFGKHRKDAKLYIPEDVVFYEPIEIKRAESWTNQTKYAFVISPHGNGLDCHRTWEALSLGCIVIVKSSPLDLLYKDLPVLIVSDWSLIDQELLNKTVSEFKDKKFDYNKLTLKYWMNKINAYKIAYNTMKQKTVIIAGCCRNVERFVETNLNIIDKIGKEFKNYNVIIYENDSTDNTRLLLTSNKKNNYDYIFENNINIQNRTERIAYCRNKLLNNIHTKYSECDYMLMLDLDDVLMSGKLPSTINSCFLYNTEQWDAMFANCSNKYYDIYALRKKKYLMSCCWNNTNELKQKGVPHNMAYNECIDKYIINYPVYTPLISVVSAFGGAGLYKMKSIKNIKYLGYEDKHLDKQICEHVPFNTSLINNGCKLYINPRMLIM
jgi:hypothetical protein